MKRLAILVLAVALLGASCNRQAPAANNLYDDGTINLAGRIISFELADEPVEQTQGLSGRESLEENQGMLFVFEVPDFLAFWMKGMNFPIDIVWLRNNQVVDISANAQPQPGVADDQLQTYSPSQPANQVLELRAGWAERNNLKIGDFIEVIQVVK